MSILSSRKTSCMFFNYMLLFHSLFKVKFDIDHFVQEEHQDR